MPRFSLRTLMLVTAGAALLFATSQLIGLEAFIVSLTLLLFLGLGVASLVFRPP